MQIRPSVLFALLVWPPTFAPGETLSVEEVVARHLASLGTAEAREQAKARVVEGACRLKLVIGGTGDLDGQTRLVSDGPQYRMTFGFEAPDYRGESVAFQRGKVDIGFMQPGRRSDLGDFLRNYDVLVREGLLGGTLSTSWPLLDLAARKAKLKVEGTKDVEGQKWLQVRYRMQRGQGDIEILLYLEPDTFRHRRTVYKLILSAIMGGEITQSSQQKETSFHLEESFSDFKEWGGLTLPTAWGLTFGHEVGGRSSLWKWESRIERVRAPRGGDDTLSAAYSTWPRAATVKAPSTDSPRAIQSRSWRLDTTQAWLGSTLTRSPTRN